jgi:hypothetical protein
MGYRTVGCRHAAGNELIIAARKGETVVTAEAVQGLLPAGRAPEPRAMAAQEAAAAARDGA